MRTVSIREAKANLSHLIEAVETGVEDEVIIARKGRAVARLVALRRPDGVGQRIGVAKDAFIVPETIDAHNDEIERMFG